jgi:rfaE bifunctional protein kinase chain/domain
MNVDACRDALARFAGQRLVVIGDVMLDEHIWGTVGRVSPEAPVMVVDVDDTECRPGGAANVAANLRALGAEVALVGVVGDDEGGAILRDRLDQSGVDTTGLVIDSDRPTTRKTRIWASHRHQVVRVDRESKRRIGASAVQELIDRIQSALLRAQAVLLSDYDKGVITHDVAQTAIRSAGSAGMISVSNAKPRSVEYYSGIDVVTLNQSEASAASGIEIESQTDAERAGEKLLSGIGCRGLVITRGAHGLSVFNGAGDIRHVPAIQSEVYDVAGAGDTVVSALTLALASGLSLPEAGLIANCAGGAVVRKVGVATTSIEEIASLLDCADRA